MAIKYCMFNITLNLTDSCLGVLISIVKLNEDLIMMNKTFNILHWPQYVLMWDTKAKWKGMAASLLAE